MSLTPRLDLEGCLLLEPPPFLSPGGTVTSSPGANREAAVASSLLVQRGPWFFL